MSTVFSPSSSSVGVRASSAGGVPSERAARRGFDGARGLSALLLAALVAGAIVIADRLIETWADGHVFLVWVFLWAVVFAATMVFAGTARRMAQRAVGWLNRWSAAAAQRRAEARMWEIAKADPRVMGELVAAQQRADTDVSTAASLHSDTLIRLARSQMPAGRRRAVFYC